MTTQIAAFDAKQKLSELLNRAHGGETIVITRHGVPYAKLVPIEAPANRDEAKRQLLERLRQQASLNLPPLPREQLYKRDEL
ncbi:type II toxin-antitoxin system Phd/YefM family antitoxin [Aquidulcibacter sp.]|jgi:prevent-host-death family protein|uniref:type II toxin-antitoxin system Phd/YefM family antitoxin n=1 Tax=Aquidulcibacter sp. TaxID=2052990 RepID=UPI003BA643F7